MEMFTYHFGRKSRISFQDQIKAEAELFIYLFLKREALNIEPSTWLSYLSSWPRFLRDDLWRLVTNSWRRNSWFLGRGRIPRSLAKLERKNFLANKAEIKSKSQSKGTDLWRSPSPGLARWKGSRRPRPLSAGLGAQHINLHCGRSPHLELFHMN